MHLFHRQGAVAALVLLAAAGGGAAELWHAQDFARRAVVRCAAGPGAAEVGSLRLCPIGAAGEPLRVAVFNPAGARVGHRVLWSAAGEALSLLFSCADGAGPYFVYYGVAPGQAAPSWESRAGIVLETRRRVDGEVDTWEQARELWDACDPVLGRSLVPLIHQGVHPHGPTEDFASHYAGHFTVPTAGSYGFATMSDHASFLLVDGDLVASWPGWHPLEGGRRGQHGGTVDLAPGPHRIDYYNIQTAQWFRVTAAWQPPGEKGFVVMPADAFVGVATFEAARIDVRPGRPDPAAFAWRLADHTRSGDLALVRVDFNVIAPEEGVRYEWTFDDGTQDRGAQVSHLFLRTGHRLATLRVLDGAAAGAAAEHLVRVRPRWEQGEDWPAGVAADHAERIGRRDLLVTPPSDIHSLFRLADRTGNVPLLDRLGEVIRGREGDFTADQAELFFELGFHFQSAHAQTYDKAEAAFRSAVRISEEGSPLRERAKLHLIGFLIHCREDFVRAADWLGGVNTELLPEGDRRLYRIFEADLLLAKGHVRRARRIYLSVGTIVPRDDRDYQVRRRARLEAARTYLERAEYDQVERVVREIEWETPLARLDTETGLLMIRANIARREYPFAMAHARRLLRATTMHRDRPEVMRLLVEVYRAVGRTAQAAEMYARLQEDFPYSEAAARAADEWAAEFRAAAVEDVPLE